MPGGCLERWGRRTFAPDNFQSTSWKRAVSYEEKLSHTDLKGKEVFPESFSSLSSRYHSKVDRDSCSGFVLLQRATTRRGRKALLEMSRDDDQSFVQDLSERGFCLSRGEFYYSKW